MLQVKRQPPEPAIFVAHSHTLVALTMNSAAPKWARALGGATASLSRAPHANRVSRLGLGCAGIGELYRSVPEAEAQEVVRYALNDAGITLFDTAPFYG